ncbi:MAG: hypothetical protein KAS86_04765, partial [Candidatus Omnitrophica bacterium]|nr:hypothetical protein [Candidatus Omnitrophota bacterium]
SQTIEQHRHELKLSREKTVDIVAEQTETRNMLIKNDADIRNMTARERRLKLERANVEREKEATREKLKIAGETVEEVRKGLEADKRKFDAFNGEYVAKQERLSLLKTEKHERERRLSGLKPRIEFFERLISEREGIGESGKEIMKRVEAGDPGFAGVRGILSEIVSVRRDYEESMESVLGDLSRAVVVDSRDVAERISGFLEENFLESMSFVILDELAAMPDGQDRRPVSDNGTLDDVTSVLVAEQPFSSAIASMLRDTFIAEAPEAARVFITENDPLVRIICKKGEIYRKGMYRSRNYSDKEVVPLFGRRERLDQMIAEERRVADEVSRMERGAGELEEWIKASRTKMGSLEDALKEKQIEYADVSSKRSVVKERSEALSDESLLLDAEIEEQSGAIGRLKEGSMGLDSRLSELEKESSGVGQKIDMSQVVIKDSSLEREKALYAISDIKAELSAMRKEEEHLAEGLVREKQDYIRLEKEVGEKGKSINECAEGITALDQEAKTLEEKITEYGDLKEIRISEDAAAKARKDDLVRCISGVEQEINENEERLESSRNRMRDIDIERKELEYKRTALVQRLSDAYKVHITGSVPEVDETFNSEEAQSRITELNNRLERMGEVSLGAVEEHKQLEERYAFLTGQREDLTKGREDVMQAIARINRTTRKLFMETFEAIKREFNVYFRMLFNGGRAELVLEDESDILESGIDIIVRPPGKKLQNITLLSGGEKAMTGIALIFAIFKVNPSPFCVLDEIDAPLDESNIVRFCRVLREFLKLSQFIIVTHNRMTIQLADVLYGITMQEKGVSKIVSVKFAEEEKQPEEENIPVGA